MGPGKKRALKILVMALIIAGGVFWGIRYFASIKIVIQPKENTFTLGKRMTVVVPAEIITLSLSKERRFITTTRNVLSKKASGIITVYNEFSSASQPIVTSTRFEASDGKIYRIAENVTIPGAKIESGKIVPSTINLTVFADRAGDEYNMKNLVDFTIPGFKGDERYKKIYAKSKTPMEGGFKGEVLVVGDSDADNAIAALTEELEEELRKSLSQAIPEGFFVPENGGGISIKTASLTPERNIKADNFLVNISGEIKAYGVKKSDTAQALVSGLQKDSVNLEKNEVLLGRHEKIEFLGADQNNVTLGVNGEITLVFSPKLTALKEALASATLATLNDVLGEFESIESARVFFSPSWWRAIPKNPDSLSIEIDFPE